MWTLETTELSEAGPFTFRITPGSTKTVGRSTAADFVLDANMVSRFHCRIEVGETGGVEVQDLESTNGTFVNDKRIKREALNPGDRLRVGRVEMVLREQQ